MSTNTQVSQENLKPTNERFTREQNKVADLINEFNTITADTRTMTMDEFETYKDIFVDYSSVDFSKPEYHDLRNRLIYLKNEWRKRTDPQSDITITDPSTGQVVFTVLSEVAPINEVSEELKSTIDGFIIATTNERITNLDKETHSLGGALVLSNKETLDDRSNIVKERITKELTELNKVNPNHKIFEGIKKEQGHTNTEDESVELEFDEE